MKILGKKFKLIICIILMFLIRFIIWFNCYSIKNLRIKICNLRIEIFLKCSKIYKKKLLNS